MLEISIGGGADGAVYSRVFDVIADIVGDMSDVWEEVVLPWALEHFSAQFETYGAHGGRPWQGYGAEPRYAEIKKEMLGHNHVLRWEIGGQELLYPSLTDRRHPNFYFRTGPHHMSIGTTVEHAADIERPTRGPWWSGSEPSPPRYIMVATDEQKRMLTTRIHRHIYAKVEGAGYTMSEARGRL